jgi:hypothetical protein
MNRFSPLSLILLIERSNFNRRYHSMWGRSMKLKIGMLKRFLSVISHHNSKTINEFPKEERCCFVGNILHEFQPVPTNHLIPYSYFYSVT